MTTVNNELKNIIEAALLVAGQPLTLDKLAALFPEDSRPERDELRAALNQLAREYADRGVELRQVDRAWRIQTREKYTVYLSRLVEERPPRYSRAMLETLAIIVYRQPVTRSDIENIRGVSVSSDIIKALLEREWIRQVGTRDVPGRPALFGTTRAFLEHFNLKSLEDLPPLAELRDFGQIGAELDAREGDAHQVRLPLGDEAKAVGESTGHGEPLSVEEPEPASLHEARSAAGE
jgi:segregation and condensation protein B